MSKNKITMLLVNICLKVMYIVVGGGKMKNFNMQFTVSIYISVINALLQSYTYFFGSECNSF